MIERKLRRMKELSRQRTQHAFISRVSNGILSATAIGSVPYYRMTDVRQVYSYLMCASGFDLDVE